MKLDIYRVIDGTDDWPLVDTIVARDADLCISLAEINYSSDSFHWTNPY